MAATVMIALGSNLRHVAHGSPRGVLRAAAATLEASGFRLLARSRLYDTRPMGPRQPRFANAVVTAETGLSPLEALRALKSIEAAFGRRSGRRWGPRVLDLDLIAYGLLRTVLPGLTLPHPGLARRPFVLVPAAEVWPDWRHPALGCSVRQLAARCGGRSGLRRAGFL